MILALANQKGGVGKTTLAYFLANRSAQERMTLMVDIDPQANLTGCFVEEIPDSSNIKILFEKEKDGEDRSTLLSALAVSETLSLVGSDPELSFWEASSNPSQYFRLSRWLEAYHGKELDGKEPLTIIDCPPNLGVFSVNAMLIADFLLIPIDASKFAIQGLRTLVHTVKEINQNFRPRDPVLVAGIVFSAINPRLNFTKRVVTQLEEEYGQFLMKTVIPTSIHVREAIADSSKIKPGPAEDAYEALYHELWERVK